MRSSKHRRAVNSPYLHAHGTDPWADPFEPPMRLSELLDMRDWSWAQQAACSGINTDLFFEREDITLNRLTLSMICSECPVRADCLQYALDNYETGWWGGTSTHDRKQMRRGT